MILIKNVTKTYHNKDGSIVRALKGVNLQLPDNGVVFVVGASGNGKSTLLNILAGLDRFDGGDVVVDGKSFKSFSARDFDEYRRRKIGFVFEESNLIESLSVKENIKLGRVLNGDAPSDEEVAEVLKKVKLTDYENRSVTDLSSGQKQRVSIARILIKSPDILFMDEPTAHLDDKNTQIIWKMVREISKTCLVVTVSHNMPLVEAYGDKVVVLENNVIGEVREIPQKDREEKRTEKKDGDKKETNKKDKEILSEKTDEVDKKPQLKRSLDFMYAFKLAANSLFYRRWRTIFMVILCTFAVTFFSIFAVMGNYNENYAMALAANSTTSKTSSIKINPYVQFQKTTTTSFQSTILQENINELNAGVLKDTEYYEFKKTHYSVEFYRDLKIDHQGYVVSGIVVVDSDKATEHKSPLGQSILYGSYPTGEAGKTGVVISDYMLFMIKHYGLQGQNSDYIPAHAEYLYLNSGKPTYWDENNKHVPEEIFIKQYVIGADININGNWYEISGIYATDFTSFMDTSKMTYSSKNSYDMFLHNLSNVYSAIHVNTNFNGVVDTLPLTTSIVISTQNLQTEKLTSLINNMVDYQFLSSTSKTIQNISDYISTFRVMLVLISVFTAIFAVVMMYYFITQLIYDRRKDVGVLKALGFSNGDISSMFVISTAMFVIIAFLFTIIITSIGAAFANASVNEILLIAFDMLRVNFAVVGYMFLVCVAIASLGAIVPLIQFAKKKPNEILKGVFK